MKTEFKRGDKVLVKDTGDREWNERIFIQKIEKATEPYIVVKSHSNASFNNGGEFDIQVWEEIKPLEKELPKSWEELSEFDGWKINEDSNLILCTRCSLHNFNRNIFATKEQAEASIAMAQLSQLMKVYNDGWTPNWSDITEGKYFIYFQKHEITCSAASISNHFLAFKTDELRSKFLENFRDLIEQAKPLL